MSGLRVISGICKGRKLKTVHGMQTRPTADRMRESLFNILGPKLVEAVVLDLFAGTGALGIEALSRGARYAVFVERRQQAVSVIRENLITCRMTDKARIIQWDVAKNLKCLESVTARFDMVFMDPPYQQNLLYAALDSLRKTASLHAETTIVIEHAADDTLQTNGAGYTMLDQRQYGNTAFSFLRPAEHIETLSGLGTAGEPVNTRGRGKMDMNAEKGGL